MKIIKTSEWRHDLEVENISLEMSRIVCTLYVKLGSFSDLPYLFKSSFLKNKLFLARLSNKT